MAPAPSTRGTTLLEVVIALAILATVLVSLPRVILMAARAAAAARQSVIASIAAGDKLEQLRGLAWAFDASGARIADVQSDVTQTPVAPTGGAGLSLSPADSLEADTPGFVDYLDADGLWVAGAGAGSPGAAFVRRWSVTALPEGPADTLVLDVRVLTPGRGGGRGLVEAARLTTLKSRRPR